MAVEWSDPPPDGRGMNDWLGIAQELRSRPGEWAKVHSYRGSSRSLALDIKNGRLTAFQDGVYEATSRQEVGGVMSTWARYIGPKED